MKQVCLVVNKEKDSIMIFKDQELAEEYLKEWELKKFEADIWAKTEEDIKLGKYFKILIQEVISNNEDKHQ